MKQIFYQSKEVYRIHRNRGQEGMKGYKVFGPDWTCKGFQYEVGKTFEEDITPSCCNRGFHFCTDLKDCFNYYPFDPDNKVAEIEALGDIDAENNNTKHCTNKIKIVREVTWEEVLKMVNLGKANSGFCNSGNWNSGSRNSGNWNSGSRNSGSRNSGNWNSGSRNSGNWNSGDCNSGNWNSGSRNSGSRNSGDWNKTSLSGGCFNTETPKINLFNKPSEWTLEDWYRSEAWHIMNQISQVVTSWIWSEDMTDEEKTEHPDHEVTGGYLKVVDQTKDNQAWWNNLPEIEQNIIKGLPNFDADIFEEITGIRV